MNLLILFCDVDALCPTFRATSKFAGRCPDLGERCVAHSQGLIGPCARQKSRRSAGGPVPTLPGSARAGHGPWFQKHPPASNAGFVDRQRPRAASRVGACARAHRVGNGGIWNENSDLESPPSNA